MSDHVSGDFCPPAGLVLGIECGASHTVALLADTAGREVRRAEFGPGNLHLLSDRDLIRLWRSVRRRFPNPSTIAVGMAGLRTLFDARRVEQTLAQVWPGAPHCATHDLETAWWAAREERNDPKILQVLVVSGTGAGCYGRTAGGRSAKAGGWGHLLGDRGSGYQIGLQALRTVIRFWDRQRRWTHLGERLLRRSQFNDPEEWIDWTRAASKDQIAALAIEVFEAAPRRDALAVQVLRETSSALAEDAVACAARLAKRETSVRFVVTGGVFRHQPRYRALFRTAVRRAWPRAEVTLLTRESVWGAVRLAVDLQAGLCSEPVTLRHTAAPAVPKSGPAAEPDEVLASLPTEQRHPRSMHLDRLPLRKAIELMLTEEARVPRLLLRHTAALERAIRRIARAFRQGGRLIYVGAGTSGRLGVLDASECPPTFRSPPEQVQGIMAGGCTALWQSLEGAEDDPEGGGRAIAFRRAGTQDVVVGIAASGRTPFVRGAVREAKRRGAYTIFLCFNPKVTFAPEERPHLLIAPGIGPEILTGSTRLKAGTATKWILNLFTTLAMVRQGKVLGNLMVDLHPTNRKLQDRATRIVCELTGIDRPRAAEALVRSQWNIKAACHRLRGSKSQ